MIKTEFKDFNQQMMYINKFITRFTDLEVKCQYCDKPAQIKYCRQTPYDVQFICKDCRKEKGIDLKAGRGEMLPDLEVIHLLEHVTSETMKLRIPVLFDDEKKIIEDILKNKLNQGDALAKYGITRCSLMKMINKYKSIDSDIETKLENIFEQGRVARMRKGKLSARVTNNIDNNLSRLKAEKNITNDDIVERSKGLIKNRANISLICNGKVEPKIQTKCILAEIFGVSVTDIFPRDWVYSNIHNYDEYCDLIDRIRTNFKFIYNKKKEAGEKGIVAILGKEFNLPIDRVYKILEGKLVLDHRELVTIITVLSDKYKINL